MVFRNLTTGELYEEVVRCEVPSMPSVATRNAFVAWNTAVKPQLKKWKTLEETVELGFLAEHLV